MSVEQPETAAGGMPAGGPDAAWQAAEFDRLLDFARASVHPNGFASLSISGEQRPDADLETYVTCRMTHVFALAHLLENGDTSGPHASKADDAELVDHGLRALAGPLRDDRYGGWFVGLAADGDIREDLAAKEAYTHAFVILAGATAAMAGRSGARALLDEALEIVDARFWEDDEGLHREAWDRTWSRSEPYRGVNANMHLVEALLAASDATGDARWRERALCILERVVDGFARSHDWRLPEHFTPDWEPLMDYNRDQPAHPFRPYGVTIGHLLEWARLCLHAQAALGPDVSPSLPDRPPAGPAHPWLREGAVALFDQAVADGWAVDGADGLVYTVDWDGQPVVRHRMHWVVTEGIAAAAALEAVTGEERYADWQATWWRYAERRLIDRKQGSWWHELDANNRVATDTWDGKPDIYHAAQATLIPSATATGAAGIAGTDGASGMAGSVGMMARTLAKASRSAGHATKGASS